MATVIAEYTIEVSSVQGTDLVADVKRVATKAGIETVVTVHEPDKQSSDWIGELASTLMRKSANRVAVESWDDADDYTASRLIEECRTEINGGIPALQR